MATLSKVPQPLMSCRLECTVRVQTHMSARVCAHTHKRTHTHYSQIDRMGNCVSVCVGAEVAVWVLCEVSSKKPSWMNIKAASPFAQTDPYRYSKSWISMVSKSAMSTAKLRHSNGLADLHRRFHNGWRWLIKENSNDGDWEIVSTENRMKQCSCFPTRLARPPLRWQLPWHTYSQTSAEQNKSSLTWPCVKFSFTPLITIMKKNKRMWENKVENVEQKLIKQLYTHTYLFLFCFCIKEWKYSNNETILITANNLKTK